MKTVLTAVALFCTCTVAYGQAHMVELYSDPDYTDCNLVDFPGLHDVYVLYRGPGAWGVSYRVDVSGWSEGTVVADAPGWPILCLPGECNPVDGIHFPLPSCDPIALLHVLTFMSIGSTPACGGTVEIAPHPDLTQVEVLDCSNTIVAAESYRLTVNGDNQLCPCNAPLPVDETTWGRVKALYRE